MADPSYIVGGVLEDSEAWVAVQSQVATQTEASVTFTSTNDGQVGDFSQYMDLCVIAYCQQDLNSEADLMYLVLNGVASGGLYSTQWLRVQNTTTANATMFDGTNKAYALYTSGDHDPSSPKPYLFSAFIFDFYDINSGKAIMYSAKSSCNVRGANSPGPLMRIGGFFYAQGPLTSIQFDVDGAGFSAGSRFDLFGILPRMVAA